MNLDLPKQLCRVEYTREILENGRVVKSFPPKRNLILDSGLNLIGTNRWANMTSYCRLGNGTTPTKRDSGNITFTRAGTTVTASDSFFVAADLNRVLKFDSGPEMYIRAVTSATVVEVSESGNDAATEGTIWYVEQSLLTNQLKMVYASSSLENGTSYDSQTGTVRHRRTFLFAIETANVLYTEIGWGTSSNGDLFGRDLIPGGGDALTNNQQYRVRVDLYVTFAPITPQPVNIAIQGWVDVAGFGMLESAFHRNVTSSGDSGSAGDGLDPSGEAICGFASASTAALTPPTDATAARALSGSVIYVKTAAYAYASGSFERSYSATFPGALGGASRSVIRSIGIGTSIPTSGVASTTTVNALYRVLLDEAREKHAYWQLRFTFKYSWGRVLIN